MNDTNVADAPAAIDSAVDTDQLLHALAAMESHADTVAAKLGPFDHPGSMLPHKSLSQLREGLKRINGRVGVCVALADRIAAEPEKAPEAVSTEESPATPKRVVTPEDEMFPQEGFSDDLTGLPSRKIAEKAIESALSVGRPRFAAVFSLDRICHMSNRYTVDVGNQAIRHCAQFLSERLPADALLFRWRGAAFVILFDHSGSPSEAKLLMEQIAIQKQKFNFMTNHRSAMVNLTVSFHTISFASHQAQETVFEAIDQFVEGHSLRQPH